MTKQIQPNSKKQEQFIASTAKECLYAGSAGSGKTFALLLSAAKKTNDPNYTALVFRNTYAQVENILLRESFEMYTTLGGTYNKTNKTWTFRSGAKIIFGYMENDEDAFNYLGMGVQFVGFDELVLFSKFQYENIVMRMRSATGIPTVIRATTNPRCEWVHTRFYHWLSPHNPPVIENDGYNFTFKTIRHNPGKDCPLLDSGTIVKISGFTRQCILGYLEDNKTLMDNDPTYKDLMLSRDKLERERYYYNNWDIMPSPGMYFRRKYFEVIDVAPADTKKIRAWDLAATTTGDYTVGLLLGEKAGIYYVEDVFIDKLSPNDVEKAISNIALQDGKTTLISIPQDPGSAGKSYAQHISKLLAGYNFKISPETGSKETRAKGISAQCEAGNVRVIRGNWNKEFWDQCEGFPDDKNHDDIVDALSRAFNTFIQGMPVKYQAFDRNLIVRRL